MTSLGGGGGHYTLKKKRHSALPPSCQLLAAYSTLDFTRSPLASRGSWHLLPITPDMLPTATKHFDRAGYSELGQSHFNIVHEKGGGSTWISFALYKIIERFKVAIALRSVTKINGENGAVNFPSKLTYNFPSEHWKWHF